jgi:hypothetical protein
LRRLSKGITFSQAEGATHFGAQAYRLIRVIFGLLTSDLNCDILSASQELGANKLNRHPIERRR